MVVEVAFNAVAVVEVTFNVVALVFALLWLWVNLYAYYPIVESIVRRTITGLRRLSVVTTPEDDQENVRDELTDGGMDVESDDGHTFDVILPAYEESEVIENSIASVRNADYDQNRINLVVLTEPNDDETRETLEELRRTYKFTELTVPSDYPGEQNKPRALNYGFEETDGNVVGIIDAENVYSSTVFHEVDGVLRTKGADFVQARLDMVNENDGWLNTLFRAEYGYWYEVVFPPFFKSNYPIPLGGTTCFFRRDVLETISERRRKRYDDLWDEDEWQWIREHGLDGSIPWDPENVTEDFELGLFLWQEGFKPTFLTDPGTDEESPLTLESWMGQRTRWQKGKIYTLMHYLRHPPDGIGRKVHLYTQSMIPHLGPVNVAAFFVFLAANLYDYSPYAPIKALLMVGLGWLTVSIGLFSLGYWKASNQSILTRVRRTIIITLTAPFYWLLNWIADIRAFRQTYKGQFHWVKTAHTGRNVFPDSDDEVGSNRNKSSTADRLTLQRRYRYTALTIITAVAASLRLNDLDWSLFGDELYTLSMRANLPASDLLFVSHDTHPPLHYLVLHYWMEIVGKSAVETRLLSVLFSVGTVVAVYALGTQLYDDRAGLVAALVTALSVYQIHYGQMVRMYSMLAFFTTASWYGFSKLQSSRTRGGMIYFVSTVLLLYTHVYAFFVFGAQNLYMFLTEDRGDINWRYWIGLQVAIGVALLPWFSFVISNLLKADRGSVSLIDWVPLPAAYHVLETVLKFIGFALNYPVVKGVGISREIATGLVFLYAVCAFLAMVRYRSDEGFKLVNVDSGAQLALLIGFPIVVPMVLSYLLFPMFYYRYTIPASIGLYVLVGRGITNISNRRIMVGVLCLIVISSGGMLGDYYNNETIEKWDPGIECLEEQTESGDLVVFQPQWIQERLDYYDLYSKVEKHYIPKPEAATKSDIGGVRKRVENRDVFWVFRYSVGEQMRSKRLLEALQKTHRQVTLMDTISIDVYRFERRNESGSATSRPRTNDTCSAERRGGYFTASSTIDSRPSIFQSRS